MWGVSRNQFRFEPSAELFGGELPRSTRGSKHVVAQQVCPSPEVDLDLGTGDPKGLRHGAAVDIEKIAERLRQFAADRDWEQFHSPKNLAMALAGEAGELIELFQWLTEEESRNVAQHTFEKERVAEELADIQIYLVRIADQLGIDLTRAVDEKIQSNEMKYPITLSKGNAIKYDQRSGR